MTQSAEAHDSSFDGWFLSLLPRVLGLTQRLVGSRAVAEDLTAEAFARALVRWHVLSEVDYRDAWVSRVATNLALDVLRRKPPYLGIEIAPRSADPQGDVDLRLALVAALQRLPRRQREAVVLRYFGQFNEREVAAALSVSAGTVKTHLRRGLAALRSDPFFADPEALDAVATE